jgi:hypothetical protein
LQLWHARKSADMRVSVQVCIKGAECEVLGAVVKQRNLAAVRKHCPPKKLPVAIRQSPFAVSPVANRQSLFAAHYSLFAIRCRFGSAGASPSQFILPPVPRPVETRSMNDFKLRH